MSLFKRILSELAVSPDQLPSSEKELHTLQDFLIDNMDHGDVESTNIGELIEENPWGCAMYLYTKYNGRYSVINENPMLSHFFDNYGILVFKKSMDMSQDPEFDEGLGLEDMKVILFNTLSQKDFKKVLRVVAYVQRYNERFNANSTVADEKNTDVFLYYEQTLKDHTLVHFTDIMNIPDIIRDGFTKGVDDPMLLGLTTRASRTADNHFTRIRGGYNFAYDIDDLPEIAHGAYYPSKYGEGVVFFRANAIKTYHTTDAEHQCIFWGKNVKDLYTAVFHSQKGTMFVRSVSEEYGKHIEFVTSYGWDANKLQELKYIIEDIMERGLENY